MSLEEVGRFLAAVKGTRGSALFTFALATGMRPQEYLGLKWTDLDFKKGSATMAHKTFKWAVCNTTLTARNLLSVLWCRGRESNPHVLTDNGF